MDETGEAPHNNSVEPSQGTQPETIVQPFETKASEKTPEKIDPPAEDDPQPGVGVTRKNYPIQPAAILNENGTIVEDDKKEKEDETKGNQTPGSKEIYQKSTLRGWLKDKFAFYFRGKDPKIPTKSNPSN